MAITKLSITGNTTSVGISSTPIVIGLANKANATSVTPDGNITTTNVQSALEQLDDIKAQASGGTLTNPSISGNVSVTGDVTASGINLGDTTLSDYKFGTWTPTNSDITFTTESAKYIKIGNLVVASMILSAVDCSNVPNNNNYFCFSGLPYSSAASMTGILSLFNLTNFDYYEISPIATNAGKIEFSRGSSINNIYNSLIDTQETNGSINLTVIYLTS